MMRVAFPFPVRIRSSVPKLQGMRFEPFVNVDGEPFDKPSLNGIWRVEMQVLARRMEEQLALSAFVTAMSASATCEIPICTHWRPNDRNGRPLARGGIVSDFSFEHVGFESDPFAGFTLREPAAPRDSYIDVDHPVLSRLRIGHMVSIQNRLYQVMNVTSIDESETASRISVMPNIRGTHPAGRIVIVDKPRLLCRMESGDQIGFDAQSVKSATLSFVEAF